MQIFSLPCFISFIRPPFLFAFFASSCQNGLTPWLARFGTPLNEAGRSSPSRTSSGQGLPIRSLPLTGKKTQPAAGNLRDRSDTYLAFHLNKALFTMPRIKLGKSEPTSVFTRAVKQDGVFLQRGLPQQLEQGERAEARMRAS